MSLFNPRIRLYILLFSLFLSISFYLFVETTIPTGSLQTIRLTQLYALTALTYLYIALLATPLTKTFPKLFFGGTYIKARRAIGFSAFCFALLHASNAFFFQLGGFSGLLFLSQRYLLAITLSSLALCILFLMALTSNDSAIKKLTFPRWKLLHRCVYVAGIFILIHALMLGSHFADLSQAIPQLASLAIAFLFLLEALRFDTYLRNRFGLKNQFGITTLVVVSFIVGAFALLLFPADSFVPLSIHQQHLQLSEKIQNTNTIPQNLQNAFPSLRGDPTKRYTVDINHPLDIAPNQPITLSLQIFDGATGKPVSFFQKNYDKLMHLIIVDNSLTYFSHIHPTQEKNTFSIQTSFPHEGIYHVYFDVQPFGAIEQQMAFTIHVGNTEENISRRQPDTLLEKKVDGYAVTLSYQSPLTAKNLTEGTSELVFHMSDATGKPVTTLKPYLLAFGHLVMINQETYEYLHVHPLKLVTNPTQNGGPDVTFVPLGIPRPIQPGIYRLFAQFNPDDHIITADFTIEVR